MRFDGPKIFQCRQDKETKELGWHRIAIKPVDPCKCGFKLCICRSNCPFSLQLMYEYDYEQVKQPPILCVCGECEYERFSRFMRESYICPRLSRHVPETERDPLSLYGVHYRTYRLIELKFHFFGSFEESNRAESAEERASASLLNLVL